VLLKQDGMCGRGFLRAQIGPDVMQVEVDKLEDVTYDLLEQTTEPFYGTNGTHTFDEILTLALYLVKHTKNI
jgi:hypothetical protein